MNTLNFMVDKLDVAEKKEQHQKLWLSEEKLLKLTRQNFRLA
jgi:hypothetical protein